MADSKEDQKIVRGFKKRMSTDMLGLYRDEVCSKIIHVLATQELSEKVPNVISYI